MEAHRQAPPVRSRKHRFLIPGTKESLCCLPLLALYTAALTATPPPGTWEMTFSDEFEGTTLDGSKWKLAGHWGGIGGQGGNNPDNIEVSDGILRLKASTAPTVWNAQTYDYGGAEITTFRRFKQRYGYFEARLRWPSVTGLWPAFWTMPDRGNYGNPYRHNRAFLKFDLSGESINTVDTATLRLTIDSFDPEVLAEDKARHVLVFRMEADDWSESNMTWNTQPSWDPLFLKQLHGVIGEPGDVIDIDVTDFVSSQLDGDGVISFALADTLMKAQTTLFHSREAATPSLRPQLIINSVSHEATEDTYVNLGNPNAKHGSSAVLNVGDYWGNTAITTHGGMEIDILEALGVWGSQRASNALHWDGYNSGGSVKNTGWGYPVEDTSEFHTYGAYWAPGLIEFYVDGELTGTFRDSRATDLEAYLLLSMQLGGWHGNDQIDPAIDGQAFEVDWVRVWSGERDPRTRDHTMVEDDGRVVFGNDFGSYGSQGIQGLSGPSADGAEFYVKGNSWIRLPVVTQVGPDTILEFQLEATDLGEIFAIGLDENNLETGNVRVFQLGGRQTWSNTYQNYRTYVDGSGPQTFSIPIGEYYTGPMINLAIVADDDSKPSIDAVIRNLRLREAGTDTTQSVPLGAVGSGVAGTDWRSGTGFLMYSAENVFSRFGAFNGNANHVVAVFYSGGQWYVDRNYGQIAFEPAPTDVLLATVNFSNDTVSSLEGEHDTYEGIHYGYADGDLAYYANVWNGGGENPAGEFAVSGSGFTPHSDVPLPLPSGDYQLGALNQGIAISADQILTGYLLYSAENVNTRFNIRDGNADHLVAVFCEEGQWYYNSGTKAVAFIPNPTDLILASIHFRDDTVDLHLGENGFEQGIRKGYLSGDIGFTPNQWGDESEDGPVSITGSAFRLNAPTPHELYNAWRIARDWAGVASTARTLWHDTDDDGRTNFAEFALGSDPMRYDSGNILQCSMSHNSSGGLDFSIEYPRPISDLDYRLQYSTDLVTWLESALTDEVINEADQTATRELEAGASEPTVFFRLMFPEVPQAPDA